MFGEILGRPRGLWCFAGEHCSACLEGLAWVIESQRVGAASLRGRCWRRRAAVHHVAHGLRCRIHSGWCAVGRLLCRRPASVILAHQPGSMVEAAGGRAPNGAGGRRARQHAGQHAPGLPHRCNLVLFWLIMVWLHIGVEKASQGLCRGLLNKPRGPPGHAGCRAALSWLLGGCTVAGRLLRARNGCSLAGGGLTRSQKHLRGSRGDPALTGGGGVSGGRLRGCWGAHPF